MHASGGVLGHGLGCEELGTGRCIAATSAHVRFGNVANDSLMLQGVKVAGSDIAVDNSEACAIDALVNAEIPRG